jgi:hypothetical protein
MKVKGQVPQENATLEEHKKFLEGSETITAQFGLKVDDRRFIEKLEALDAKTILELAQGIVENLEFIADLV